jgi:hypothetical protein
VKVATITRTIMGKWMSDLDLTGRLQHIEGLENELIKKGAGLLGVGTGLRDADFFIMGAMRRTLAQARGFRDLIKTRNFPCAAALLRLQLDTAMRVNALSMVEDPDAVCKAVLEGEQFNRLKSRDGQKLSDAFLREKLAEEHPWISMVYKQTSDLVHLSGRHFQVSIAGTDDETGAAFFFISGHDPDRPDETYFEVVDAFFKATKVSGMLMLAFLTARHRREEMLALINREG